ncbi:hypothetical protein CD790_25295 [Streptomyces sp. SAJ15]|nr:hypothetical protein CD790_25295 [Streptomyces sp. SAJ15]
MDDCEDCGRTLCRDCDTHYCIEQCPCGRSHTCDCACTEYLEGLATEALWVQPDEAVSARQEGEQRHCDYTKRHPSHTFMRLEVLFQCPGEHGTECER